MVDDYGPEGMRAAVEERLGRELADFALDAPPEGFSDHVGVHAQRQPGLVYVGVPVHLGLVSGEQMTAVADLAEALGGDVRITRLQNFVLANVPEERVDEAVAAARARSASRSISTRVRAASLACTGEPHCNYSVTETKTRADALIQALEARFGDEIAGLRLHLDGCPHACAQHWVGDLGFQGTTVRDEQGKRRQAYDVFLRGGLGAGAAIARPVFRRVPTEELDATVEGLVAGWLGGTPRRRVVPRVLRPLDRRRARRPRRPRAGASSSERRRQREPVRRGAGRARGRRAVGRVRGPGAAGAARVGVRAVLAADRDLDRVPDRRLRPDRHGVRASTRT